MSEPSTEIVFFIDRCLGKRYIVEALKDTGISVEIHDDHFPQAAQDVTWMPEVGKRGWIILTKDAAIGRNQLERQAVAYAGIRMFALASQNLSGREMAEIFRVAILAMQKFIEKNPAPFIAKVYREGKVKSWKTQADLLAELEED